jgi:hypothetical protein
MWEPQHLTTVWAFTACYRDTFTFFFSPLWRKLSNDQNHDSLIITIGVQHGLTPFQGREQHTFSQTQISMLAFTIVTTVWSLQYSWEDCINALPQVSPQEKHPLELDLVTEETMQSALDIQSTFLDMSRSVTARHLPHTAMDISHAEITTLPHS